MLVRQMSTKFIEQINLVSSMIKIIKSKALRSLIQRNVQLLPKYFKFIWRWQKQNVTRNYVGVKSWWNPLTPEPSIQSTGLGPRSCEKLGCQYHADLLCRYQHQDHTRTKVLIDQNKAIKNSHSVLYLFYLVTNPSRGRKSLTNQLN